MPAGILPRFSAICARGNALRTHIEIVTPVIGMRIWEIVKRGMELGAPLDRTWSCNRFDDAACGECDSCRLRLSAFDEAGIGDPIAYRVRVER
jgi:7-cyano-7-deazaguanine synthase